MLNRLFAQLPIELTQTIQTKSLAHLTMLVDAQNTLEDTLQCLQLIKNFMQNQPEQLAEQGLNTLLNLIARIMRFTTEDTPLCFTYEACENSISHLYSSHPETILIAVRNKDLAHFERLSSVQEKYEILKKMYTRAVASLNVTIRQSEHFNEFFKEHEPEMLPVYHTQEVAVLNFMEELLDIMRGIYFPSLSPSPTRMSK